MNSQGLWKQRFIGYSKEMQKYLRYIFNGHLVFVMVIGLGGLAYYYSNWVKTLHNDFPAALIMAVVLGALMARSPVMTFLKEPDMIFLLPLETKLKSYFQKSIILSLVMQGYVLLFVFAAFMPMFAKVTGANLTDFVSILVAMIIIKYINLYIHWYVLKFQDPGSLRMDGIVRLLINISLLYLVFSKANIVFSALLLVLLLGLLFYYRKATVNKAIKWERLIELEGKRMMAFYRIANLFTDVPKLRGKVVRRKWLDWILAFIPYKQQDSYLFLYARTMLRANDYAGLVLRLTVIGSVIMLGFQSIWSSVFVAVLMLYMTGIQLLPVWKQHELKIWVSIYPIPAKMRETAVVRLVTYFLHVENIVFLLVLLLSGNWITAFVSFLVGLVFIFIFRGYAQKKITSF